MKSKLQTLALSAFIGFLFILPLLSMEVLNRRKYGEDFPIVLFFFMWQLVFAISLILLPAVRARRPKKPDMENSETRQGTGLFANPRTAAMISIGMFLSLGVLALLDSLGWVPLQSLINGPNPERDFLPGLFVSVSLFWIAVCAVMIANTPVVRTLQAGGSLFAHPLNMAIVVLFVSFLAIGVTNLVIDQWPCFIGVPLCD